VRHKESFATRETEEFYDRGWGVEVAAAFPKYKRVRRDSYIFWANPVCTSAVCVYIYFCEIGIWSFPNSIAKRNTHGGIHQTLTPNIKGNSLKISKLSFLGDIALLQQCSNETGFSVSAE